MLRLLLKLNGIHFPKNIWKSSPNFSGKVQFYWSASSVADLICWRSQSEPSPSSEANDSPRPNQKAPLIWFPFSRWLTFPSSLPLLNVTSLVQFAYINRRPRQGTSLGHGSSAFRHCLCLVSRDPSVEPDLEESYIKQFDSKPKQPLKH